jgi:hypothetical protein
LTTDGRGDIVNKESERCIMTTETIFENVRERCKGMVPGESVDINTSEVGGTIDLWSVTIDLNLELENGCRTFATKIDPKKGLIVTCLINQEV